MDSLRDLVKERLIFSSDHLQVHFSSNFLTSGTWALPAYALKGVQSAGRNYFYRNETHSVFGTRFTPGIVEYKNSTQEEREEVLQVWCSKGFYDRVKSRGEVKDDCNSRHCKLDGCQIMEPHSHDIQDSKEELID